MGEEPICRNISAGAHIVSKSRTGLCLSKDPLIQKKEISCKQVQLSGRAIFAFGDNNTSKPRLILNLPDDFADRPRAGRSVSGLCLSDDRTPLN